MTFKNQNFFYHKHGKKEIPLKVIKEEIVSAENPEQSMISVTFRCTGCRQEFVYKISVAGIKAVLPKENSSHGYTR